MLTYVYIPNSNIYRDFVNFALDIESFVKYPKRFYIYSDCQLFIARRRKDIIEFIPYSREHVSHEECVKSFMDCLLKKQLAPVDIVDGSKLIIDSVNSEIVKINEEIMFNLFINTPPVCFNELDKVLYFYTDENAKDKIGTYIQNFGYSAIANFEYVNDWLIPGIDGTVTKETLKWILDIVAETEYYPEVPDRIVNKILPYFKGNYLGKEGIVIKQPTTRLKNLLKIDNLPIEITEPIDEIDETSIPKDLPYAESLSDILDGFPIPMDRDILIDVPVSNKIISCYARENWLYFTVKYSDEDKFSPDAVNKSTLEEQLGISNFSISFIA